jgi:hypothetical protein
MIHHNVAEISIEQILFNSLKSLGRYLAQTKIRGQCCSGVRKQGNHEERQPSKEKMKG